MEDNLPIIKFKNNSGFVMAICRGLTGLTLVISAPALTAQNSSENLVDVSQCVVLLDATERLSCFDQATAHLKNRDEQDVVSLISVPPPAQPRAAVVEEPANIVVGGGNNDVADFGKTSTEPRVLESADGTEELFDRVASLRKRAPNLWVITLESGQVWLQSNSQFFRLTEGDEVQIYPSSLGGSYRLKRMDMNGFIQVERVE